MIRDLRAALVPWIIRVKPDGNTFLFKGAPPEKSIRASIGSVEGPSVLSITRITIVAAILEGDFRAIWGLRADRDPHLVLEAAGQTPRSGGPRVAMTHASLGAAAPRLERVTAFVKPDDQQRPRKRGKFVADGVDDEVAVAETFAGVGGDWSRPELPGVLPMVQ